MDILIKLSDAPVSDIAAVVLLLMSFWITGYFAEHPPKNHPSVSVLMEDYRREWMKVFVTRTPRLFDVSLMTSLRQGTTFFASASMIAIGGGAAMIGNTGAMRELAHDLPIDAERIDLALKLMLPVCFMANALLKFIWAHRLFGYCAIVMAAVPNDPSHEKAYILAAKAAELNGTAAKSYNRGLRTIYFALASLTWLFGPVVLFIATVATTGVMVRREFWSQSRQIILNSKP